MECPEALRVQALFDGEVDPLAALEVEQHLTVCPECHRLMQDLGHIRTWVRGAAPPMRVPLKLRQQIQRSLEEDEVQDRTERLPSGDRPLRGSGTFWLGLASGAAGGAVAAVLVTMLLMTPPSKPLLDDIVADHTRALLASHLVDVVSTSQHTVKPWFAGRTDVSPVVADFTAQGYQLIGGRADYLDHQRAAVVVYQHGPHYINVFSWPLRSNSVPRDATRNGYHLAFWKSGNVGYCAISDTGWNELQGLVRLLQDLGARDNPE